MKIASPGGAAQMKVFIENEAGSFVKHLYDEKTLELKGTTRVSRAYPFPYGFVLDTTAEDGDNVDCFVLTGELLSSGTILDCEPLALMEQIEDGQVDHKILAAIPGQDVTLDPRTRQSLIDFTSHVFDHVPGKIMKVGAFRDRQAAIDHMLRHTDAAAVSSTIL
jgi:inorganic pyrophosphatase